jgi:hypothetical protein
VASLDTRALFDAEVVPLMNSRQAAMARLETAFATVVHTPGSAAAVNVAANPCRYRTSALTAPFEKQFSAGHLWCGDTMECPACAPPPPQPQGNSRAARAARAVGQRTLAALADHMEEHARNVHAGAGYGYGYGHSYDDGDDEDGGDDMEEHAGQCTVC